MAKELSARECEVLELTEKLNKESKDTQLLREDNDRLNGSIKTMRIREEQVQLVTMFSLEDLTDESHAILSRILYCLDSWRQVLRGIVRRM